MKTRLCLTVALLIVASFAVATPLTPAQKRAIATEMLVIDRLWHDGKYAEIIPHLQAVLAIDPLDTETWDNLAWMTWNVSGDPAKAITVHKQAITTNPKRWESWNALGSFYAQNQSQPARAIPYLARAMRLGAGLNTGKLLAHSLHKCHLQPLASLQWYYLGQAYPNGTGVQSNIRSARVKLATGCVRRRT